MISDRLYGLAFEYKKTKLWERLLDTHVFAVKLSDGRIGYVSIMGFGGQHCALGLYIESAGLDSLRVMARADELLMPQYMLRECWMQQDCLQCIFAGKDELSEEEREDVKRYARGHGIRIAGKNAYPQFMKFLPYYYPGQPETEEEQELLCEALSGAVALAGFLKGKSPEELGLHMLDEETEEVPLLERDGDTYALGRTKLPQEAVQEIPAPKADNDISVAKLKKLKKKGVWECGLIRCPEPVQNDPEEVPYFPMILLAVDSDAGFILPVLPVKDYQEKPEELLDIFMEELLKEKVCPAQIRAQDERTYRFAEDFCQRLGIAVSVEKDLPMLEEMEAELMEHLGQYAEKDLFMDGLEDELDGMEGALDMLGALLDMDERKLDELSSKLDELSARMGAEEDIPPEEMERFLKVLPGGLVKQFQGMLEEVISSEELEGNSNRILDFQDAGRQARRRRRPEKYQGPERSFVISVSLGTGCYRHIRIAGESTLFDLHGAILDAFGFDDDHAHAFFMDNAKWSHRDCYYSEGVEDGYPVTSGYELNQVDLSKGKQFKYIFDFGDEWTFQCKVLRIVEGGTSVPFVVKSKGKAPDQYGYEDWGDEDDDE